MVIPSAQARLRDLVSSSPSSFERPRTILTGGLHVTSKLESCKIKPVALLSTLRFRPFFRPDVPVQQLGSLLKLVVVYLPVFTRSSSLCSNARSSNLNSCRGVFYGIVISTIADPTCGSLSRSFTLSNTSSAFSPTHLTRAYHTSTKYGASEAPSTSQEYLRGLSPTRRLISNTNQLTPSPTADLSERSRRWLPDPRTHTCRTGLLG